LIVSKSVVLCGELVPLLPVMVTVTGLVVTDAGFSAEIFSIELVPAVTELGVKLALTLEGRPEMLSATVLLAPIIVVFTVTEPFNPRLTVSDVGATEMPKSAPVVTVSETLMGWIPFPLMTRVEPATGVVAVVITVSVDVPELLAGGVTDNGLSEQVVFAGQPVTVKATELLKLPMD
jgi:hypothetical protein